eukprot:388946-Pyramimonas_sp.AAC.1
MDQGADYIEQKKPTIFLFENVAALATHSKYSAFFGHILDRLDMLGICDISYSVMDTKKHGGIPVENQGLHRGDPQSEAGLPNEMAFRYPHAAHSQVHWKVHRCESE